MRFIRWLVYRLGFRPKYGTRLYSPSRAYAEVSAKAIKILTENLSERLKTCRGNPNVCVAEGCYAEACVRNNQE